MKSEPTIATESPTIPNPFAHSRQIKVNSLEEIRAAIRYVLLEENQLTPYVLAQRLKGKISQRTIYDFVNSGKSIDLKTLLAICETMGFHLHLEKPSARMVKINRKKLALIESQTPNKKSQQSL